VRDLLSALLLIGVGAGLAFPSLMTLAMSAATPEDSGLTSGLVNTSQQVGGALGLAVLATIASNHTAALRAHHTPLAPSLTAGYHLAWTIAAALVLAAITVGCVLLRPAAAREQHHPTAQLARGGAPYLEEAA
jgi:MFS family permease